VSAERANHAVATLCRVLGVSVSGFYAWLRAIPVLQTRAEAEAELRGQIDPIFAARGRVYGSPRVHAELRREGRRHSRRRVARLMREMGLSARRGRRRRTPRTTDSRHDLPVAPNLLARNCAADRPDQVWLADISYISTDEGFLYLAAVKDMGHPRDRRLVDGRPPQGRAVHRRPGHGHPAASAAARAGPPQRQ
jgi:putative transposase